MSSSNSARHVEDRLGSQVKLLLSQRQHRNAGQQQQPQHEQLCADPDSGTGVRPNVHSRDGRQCSRSMGSGSSVADINTTIYYQGNSKAGVTMIGSSDCDSSPRLFPAAVAEVAVPVCTTANQESTHSQPSPRPSSTLDSFSFMAKCKPMPHFVSLQARPPTVQQLVMPVLAQPSMRRLTLMHKE